MDEKTRRLGAVLVLLGLAGLVLALAAAVVRLERLEQFEDLGLNAETLGLLGAPSFTPLRCFRFPWGLCSTESVPAWF